MKSTEVVAKTKEEAVSKALEDLQLTRSQASIEVLGEESGGFLGLGGKRVRVRVSEIAEGDKARGDAVEGDTDPSEVVRRLLELMGVNFTLSIDRQGEELNIMVNSPDDDGLLIGRRGQTLDAIRHLAQRITSARAGHNILMNIDIGDYRARREASLCEIADNTAAQVLKEERSMSIEPMSSQDRRIIHVHLMGREDLHTYTVGGGARRRVVVAPGPEGSGDSRRSEEEDDFRSEESGRGRRSRGGRGGRSGGQGREPRDDRRDERPAARQAETQPKAQPRTKIDVQPDTQPASNEMMRSAYDEIPDPGFQSNLLGAPARGARGGGRGGRGYRGGNSENFETEEARLQREEHRLRSEREAKLGGGRGSSEGSSGERGGSERGSGERSGSERGGSERGSGERGGERQGAQSGEGRPRRSRSRGRGRDGRGRDGQPREERNQQAPTSGGDSGASSERSAVDGRAARSPGRDRGGREERSPSREHSSGEDRGARAESGAGEERSQREDRGQRSDRNDRGDRNERGGRGNRGGRGERGGRGDRDDRESRGRQEREEYDASFSSDEPGAKSLTEVPVFDDGSREKAFSSDLAKQILQIGAGGDSKKQTGRRRRR